jgi:hypothetical protein
MRVAVVVLAVLASASTVVAAPPGGTPAMAPTPPSAPVPSASPLAGHLEVAVRAGLAKSELVGTDNEGQNGSGPLLDAEVGWRTHAFSIAAFAAYSSFHSSGWVADTNHGRADFVAFNRLVDIGGRLRVHYKFAFAGLGLASEQIGDKGTVTMTNDRIPPEVTVANYNDWRDGRLFELHVGAMTGKLAPCGCALELVASYTTTSTDFGATINSKRLALGVQF